MSSSQIILKFGSIGNTLKLLCDDLELNNFPTHQQFSTHVPMANIWN